MTHLPPRAKQSNISIVIPVHNEAAGLTALYERIDSATQKTSCSWSFLFVNDGSTDDSRRILEELQREDSRIGIINLSRCFGKEYALSAGLMHVHGDAVVVMDADLQEPPECLPAMLDAWQSGFDVVAMRRSDRQVDTWFKRRCAGAFYALVRRLGDVEIPADVGDFRLMSRRVVDVINQLPESNRCLKGLFAWVGYKTILLDFEREARNAGDTKWPLRKLVGLAVDGITAFSIAPLRVATLTGSVTAILAVLFGVFTVIKTLLIGDPVPGFTTLLTVITFLGGVQLLAIGILGEYVGRTFLEVKQRPLYVVESVSLPTPRQEPSYLTDAKRRLVV